MLFFCAAQAARRLVAADESGASVVLSLLRKSIASKSIRVAELFNAMDTSKDGLISRRGPRIRRCAVLERIRRVPTCPSLTMVCGEISQMSHIAIRCLVRFGSF